MFVQRHKKGFEIMHFNVWSSIGIICYKTLGHK
jgi:hypothetical protein